ncbi:hypothetical protein HanXRQr2_Chr14g0623031 [Helianthus annuus]|uniref:Reverse transcriptase zinc-binding domain-containing protein n=1 Tax=Helianthus annuus TaxID=4232 RepID=A0A9K3E799_HELAN|nr:hypothetical protein HanXRQr2_Chr14g0623031 [Helianthus annuus]
MAWEKVTLPIEYGGVGLGSFLDTNLAMLVKWWWRFKLEQGVLSRKVVWSFIAALVHWILFLDCLQMRVRGTKS